MTTIQEPDVAADSAELLERAIQACPQPQRLRATLDDQRALRDVCLNLAGVISDVVPKNSTDPLLNHCLRTAWSQYNRAVASDMPPTERAHAFLFGICTAVSQALTLRRRSDAEELLDAAIEICSEPLHLRHAFDAHPALREVSLNLARMVCDVVPAKNGEPLLHHCLKEAWRRYGEAEAKGMPLQDRAFAFLQGICSLLDQVFEVRVYMREGETITPWRPGVETLAKFLERYPHSNPSLAFERYAEVDVKSARQAVAAHVIDLRYVDAIGGSFDSIL
jgi:hypothetical protein